MSYLSFSDTEHSFRFNLMRRCDTMPIEIHLDRVMLEKKISLIDLSKEVGITNVNLSKLKTGKISAIKLSTLESICEALDCQPGDILEFRKEE